jgi:hypothetical protein
MTRPRIGPRYQRLVQLSHHVTWFLGTRFPKAIPLVFVVGYPKSGTTWASHLVADYLGLPWPRLSLMPVGCEAVVHGHERVWERYPRCVYVMRDGRDALVSQYFFLTRGVPEGNHPRLTARQRRELPGLVNKANVRENLPRFLERQMTRPHSSRANWGEHVRSYLESNKSVALLRFEDLLRDGVGTLAQAMRELTDQEPDLERARESIDRYAFERRAGRQPGQEDRSAFLRKGQAGDWRNHFTREAAEIFDRYCGEMLIRAGYEPDHAWVASCPPLGEVTRSEGGMGKPSAAGHPIA